MATNDVILNKTTTIQRYVKRIYGIDLAMHIVSERKLGVPKASREAFKLLQEAGIIDASLAKTLMNMVGFRNIAVHDYQALELGILEAILEKHIDDFKEFTKVILQLEEN